ncbi:MAG: hypothetical protein DRI57_22605 [Deltaproteobacteria bacterium]|nr:MAG: hypothetical protein DRI57_22605 [Deltaproteobacteria bacterium]
MNADERGRPDSSAFIRVHPRFVKAVFPGKNHGKLLAGYLQSFLRPCHQRTGKKHMQKANRTSLIFY